MFSIRRYVRIATLVLLTGLAAACDQTTQIAAPTTTEDTPQQVSAQNDLSVQAKVVSWRNAREASVSSPIASDGGWLVIYHGDRALAALHVPEGVVVRGSVTFTMTLKPIGRNQFVVDLDAGALGERGFNQPVYLFADLDHLDIPAGQVPGFAEYNDGVGARVVSTVHRGYLVGLLHHFSGYVPIAD